MPVNVKNLIFVCCIAGLCMACTPRAIREARDVVAQADSLWHAGQMYGVDAGDSATLAQAYETLATIPLPFREGLGLGSSYARSCYHYGRLLRAKEDPVAAMQVFINATHSHTRDYHILGRVYSNMGSICHLAGEFPLSYDMYEKSANMFLLNGESLLYYYGLNNMAFELAMLSDTSFILITNKIERECSDKGVMAKVLETKTEAYYRTKQYNQALLYANELTNKYGNYPLGLLVKAQIFSNCGIKDSAVHYAKLVLQYSNDISDIHNALYILTNDDLTKDKTAIRETAAKRSDVQKLLEIRRGKLSQAAQLLEQELNRTPNLNWLYAILATILIIGIGIGVYVTNRRKNNKLLKQEFDSLNQATEEIKEKHNALNAQYNINYKRIEEEIYRTCDLLRSNNNITKDLSWSKYENMCEIVDRNFYMFVSKLHHLKELNETETRLCILVLIGYNRPQIAQILPYASNSVGKLKDQTAKLLGTTGKNLRNYLLKIAVER